MALIYWIVWDNCANDWNRCAVFQQPLLQPVELRLVASSFHLVVSSCSSELLIDPLFLVFHLACTLQLTASDCRYRSLVVMMLSWADQISGWWLHKFPNVLNIVINWIQWSALYSAFWKESEYRTTDSAGWLVRPDSQSTACSLAPSWCGGRKVRKVASLIRRPVACPPSLGAILAVRTKTIGCYSHRP